MDVSNFSIIFGENLSAFRESKNMTVQMLSAICDFSTYTIQNYQLGRRRPNFKRLIKICNANNVSPNILLERLYDFPNELEDLDTLNKAHKLLSLEDRIFLNGLLDYVTSSMINIEPKLKGISLGSRVRLLRIAAGMDIEDFSNCCICAASTMHGIESDQHDPSVEIFLRMCNVLKVSPEYLAAPLLTVDSSYSNPDYQYLRPQQFKTLLAISTYYENKRSME